MCALFLFRFLFRKVSVPFQKTDLHTLQVHPGSYPAVISGFPKKQASSRGQFVEKNTKGPSRRFKTAYIQKLRSKSVWVGHPGGCLLHSLVFGVSLRCSKAVMHVDTVLHHVCTFLSPYHHFICVYVLSTSAWPSPASE